MRGWRWWGYVIAESLTLFGLGLGITLKYFELAENNPTTGLGWGVGLMVVGVARFVIGARDERRKPIRTPEEKN